MKKKKEKKKHFGGFAQKIFKFLDNYFQPISILAYLYAQDTVFGHVTKCNRQIASFLG